MNRGKLSYGYGEYDEVTGITQSTADGEGNAIHTRYDCGVVTELTSGLHTVNYVYDVTRRKQTVTLDNDSEYAVSYTYDDASAANGYVDTTTVHKNNNQIQTQTDRHGNILSLKVQEGMSAAKIYLINTYDTKGQPLTCADNVTKSQVTYTYDSVIKDQLNSVTRTSGTNTASLIESFAFDVMGRPVSRALSGAVSHTYGYEYKSNTDSDLEYIATPNKLKVFPQTDVNGRSQGKIVTDPYGSPKYGEYVSYLKVGDHATNRISSVRYGHIKAASHVFDDAYVIDDVLQYKYDACGNISQINENGLLSVKYTYDSLNRLIREDNKTLDKTMLFSYDNVGNILYKRTANYTLKQPEEITFTESLQYTYDGAHPDRLIGFGEQSITYNAQNLPQSYCKKTLDWNNLGQLTGVDGKVYTYDGSGKRIKKDELVFTYDLSGRLIKQNNGLEFFYDENGLNSFRSAAKNYIYRKTAQGDISAILDETGQIVVNYVYDAWGNCTITKDTNGIAELNPFRYRGYYFDVETGLYYLQTRYYDPKIGRFISQDDVNYLDPETLGGLNLYAYCGNNPVMRVDPNGNAWWDIFKWIAVAVVAVAAVAAIVVGTVVTGGALSAVLIGAGVGALVGGTWGGISAHVNGTDIASGILGGALTGAALGAAAPLAAFGAAGFGIMVVTTLAAGALAYTAETLGNNQAFNIGHMFSKMGFTALQGAMAFGLGTVFNMADGGIGVKLITGYLSKALAGQLGFAMDISFSSISGEQLTKNQVLLKYLSVWFS